MVFYKYLKGDVQFDEPTNREKTREGNQAQSSKALWAEKTEERLWCRTVYLKCGKCGVQSGKSAVLSRLIGKQIGHLSQAS